MNTTQYYQTSSGPNYLIHSKGMAQPKRQGNFLKQTNLLKDINVAMLPNSYVSEIDIPFVCQG